MATRAAPLPRRVLLGLAGLCFRQKDPLFGLCLFMGFQCILRKGELLRLSSQDFVFSLDGRFVAVARGRTKAGSRRHETEKVIMDDPRLVALASRLLAAALAEILLPRGGRFRRIVVERCDTRGVHAYGHKPY